MIRELRGWSRAPVIVLSGRAGSGDKIGALDAGADDYVTKPFDMEELLARLRAALRRDDPAPAGGQVQHRPRTRSTWPRTRTVEPGTDGSEPVTGTSPRPSGGCWRSCCATRASWSAAGGCSPTCGGPASSSSTHYLRFHMAGLRRKLEDDPARPAAPADRARHGLPVPAVTGAAVTASAQFRAH